MRHTPGPWWVRGRVGFGHHIVSTRESPCGQIAVAYGECNPDGEANAAMIAAAPDLADALETLLEIVGNTAPGEEIAIDAAEAALRAAGRLP